MLTKLMEPLLKRTSEYGKVTYELLRLKIVDKASDLTSTLFSKFLLFSCMLVFAFFVNIGVSLWLGKLLGANYYGFGVVALFYGLVGIVLYLTRSRIKAKFYNFLIRKFLNTPNEHETNH